MSLAWQYTPRRPFVCLMPCSTVALCCPKPRPRGENATDVVWEQSWLRLFAASSNLDSTSGYGWRCQEPVTGKEDNRVAGLGMILQILLQYVCFHVLVRLRDQQWPSWWKHGWRNPVRLFQKSVLQGAQLDILFLWSSDKTRMLTSCYLVRMQLAGLLWNRLKCKLHFPWMCLPQFDSAICSGSRNFLIIRWDLCNRLNLHGHCIPIKVLSIFLKSIS